MKIEKLYKLTLNDDYTDNDKMVFKYAFDMLFDMGLERNKAETIKFIQTIIDEGYFNRQELYNEALKVPDLYFTRAIKEALLTLTSKAICTNEEAKNMFLSYIIKVFLKAVPILKKFAITENNKIMI